MTCRGFSEIIVILVGGIKTFRRFLICRAQSLCPRRRLFQYYRQRRYCSLIKCFQVPAAKYTIDDALHQCKKPTGQIQQYKPSLIHKESREHGRCAHTDMVGKYTQSCIGTALILRNGPQHGSVCSRIKHITRCCATKKQKYNQRRRRYCNE